MFKHQTLVERILGLGFMAGLIYAAFLFFNSTRVPLPHEAPTVELPGNFGKLPALQHLPWGWFGRRNIAGRPFYALTRDRTQVIVRWGGLESAPFSMLGKLLVIDERPCYVGQRGQQVQVVWGAARSRLYDHIRGLTEIDGQPFYFAWANAQILVVHGTQERGPYDQLEWAPPESPLPIAEFYRMSPSGQCPQALRSEGEFIPVPWMGCYYKNGTQQLERPDNHLDSPARFAYAAIDLPPLPGGHLLYIATQGHAKRVVWGGYLSPPYDVITHLTPTSSGPVFIARRDDHEFVVWSYQEGPAHGGIWNFLLGDAELRYIAEDAGRYQPVRVPIPGGQLL